MNHAIYSTLFSETDDEADDEVREIVGNFVENWLPTTEKKIHDASSIDDWAQIQSAIHAVKGSAGGFGYMLMTDLAKDIELAIKADEHSKASALLEQFHVMCEGIYTGFKKQD